MNIIYRKDINTSIDDFFEEALTNDKISGIFLAVTITKDDIGIVVDPSFYDENIGINFTLEELEKLGRYNFIKLREALKLMDNYNKKIVLDILPIYLLDITEENLEEKTAEARRYISMFKEFLEEFPNEDIYICTSVQRTLYILNEIIKDRKLGLIVTLFNLTYVDIDFYVINIDMVNTLILNQELSRRKEIMIQAITKKDIETAREVFLGEEQSKIINQLYFITDYPNELYNALTKK